MTMALKKQIQFLSSRRPNCVVFFSSVELSLICWDKYRETSSLISRSVIRKGFGLTASAKPGNRVLTMCQSNIPLTRVTYQHKTVASPFQESSINFCKAGEICSLFHNRNRVDSASGSLRGRALRPAGRSPVTLSATIDRPKPA